MILAAGELTFPQALLFFYVPFVVSTTFHEAAHALIAKLGGDETAYRGGQVTLNPLPHMQREPFGMVVLPLLLLFMTGGRMTMGWASAPIDPFWAARYPRRAALVSLAGPLTNFLLATVAFVILKFMLDMDISQEGSGANKVWMIVNSFLILNIVLGILNLIPLPPLDGAGVLEGLFPRSVGNFYGLLRAQPYIMLIVMIALMTYGGRLWWPIIDRVQSWVR